MAQLATVATIAASAANVAQGISQSRSSAASSAAVDQQQAARTAELQAQAAERARQRQALVEKTVASTRARLGASGTSTDDGSGAALIDGLRQDAADAQSADDQQLSVRLSAGRRSLLDSSGALTGFTRAVRGTSSLGSGLRSLLDVF